MRVLGYIHTFNDDDVIDLSLAALRRQTRPLDKIIIVDNGSTDATLDRQFPADITVIRHGENLGTNGSVRTGLRYALDHGYDWAWLFDADSAPEPDALRQVLEFYGGLSPEEQDEVCFLGCKVVGSQDRTVHVPLVLTADGGRPATADPARPAMRCDVALWTSALYRLKAVTSIGLPSEKIEHFVDRRRQHDGVAVQEIDVASPGDVDGAIVALRMFT